MKRQLMDKEFYIMRVLWGAKETLTAKEIKASQPAIAEKRIGEELKKLNSENFITATTEGKETRYQAVISEQQYVLWLNG